MEIWEVVGFRKVSFKGDKTNKDVNGYTLFLERRPEVDSIQGMECQKLFFSADYVSYTPAVGDTVEIQYNRYGKIGSIKAV